MTLGSTRARWVDSGFVAATVLRVALSCAPLLRSHPSRTFKKTCYPRSQRTMRCPVCTRFVSPHAAHCARCGTPFGGEWVPVSRIDGMHRKRGPKYWLSQLLVFGSSAYFLVVIYAIFALNSAGGAGWILLLVDPLLRFAFPSFGAMAIAFVSMACGCWMWVTLPLERLALSKK